MMDEVMEKIRTFTRKYTIGRTNGRELSVDLGEICHYMTDFFTYPHNDDIYEHNLLAHYVYEKRVALVIRRRMTEDKFEKWASPIIPPTTVDTIVNSNSTMQDAYRTSTKPKGINYDQQHMPPAALFTWVGLANFASLFGGQSLSLTFSYAFGRVLSWTLVWAFFATFTNFFGGVFLAMLINNKKTKCQKLWRTLFIITIAVPQLVTLLLVRNFFSDAGIFNTMMANAGVTDFLKAIGLLGQNMNHIPFLTDQHWAKFMIILINIWVGGPYQMLIATGVLMNTPTDLLEASTIDGASPWQSFIHIKLPYLLSVQGPALVTDFVRNVNNFNVIYLLTQDVYITKDQALASSSAKEVDLLVTWLFRLTQEQYNYKMAAVIGIMVFIICAVFTLVCFRFLNKKEATFS